MGDSVLLRRVYRNVFKRMVDFCLACIGLVLVSPVFLIISILVRLKLGKPIIFKQQRPGLNEKIFTLYKFRTMTDEKDEFGNLLSDEIRLTKFGAFLRSTSLDKLPELINIIKGDMSIVGPRPLLVKYLPLYNSVQRQRHNVRPGLTGLAQINGRNSIKWEEKFDYDITYIKELSLLLDLKIIIKTIQIIFTRDGINSETNVTMEEFMGEVID